MLEFNIAPNTQIGRINIWNPTKAIYNPPAVEIVETGTAKNKIKHEIPVVPVLKPGSVVYIRRDNMDNPFVDLYSDPKYTQYITRLYDLTFDDNKLPIYHSDTFDPKHFKITEVKIYKNEDAYNTDHYMRAGEYIENLVSDNIIEFGKRWLGLAGFEEFSLDMQEYFNKFYTCYSNNGWYGFAHYYPETQTLVECPIKDAGGIRAIPAFEFNKEPERPMIFHRTYKENGVNPYDKT